MTREKLTAQITLRLDGDMHAAIEAYRTARSKQTKICLSISEAARELLSTTIDGDEVRDSVAVLFGVSRGPSN